MTSSLIADKVRSEIPDTNYHFPNFLKSRNRNWIFLSPNNPEEVLRVVDSFSETKSAGPHSIPVRILKLLKLGIASPISTLINRSFEMGIFPTLLKTSKVIPIFKNKGSMLNNLDFVKVIQLSMLLLTSQSVLGNVLTKVSL